MRIRAPQPNRPATIPYHSPVNLPTTFRFRLLLVGAAMLFGAAARAQIVNPVPTAPADSSRLRKASQSSNTDDKVFANPSVLGMGPSKGLIIRYERAPDFSISSK